MRDHLAGSGGWYAPYHDRLREALDKLAQNFGRWERLEDFHKTGEIAIDLMRDLGVSLSKVDETNCYVEVNWLSPTLLIAFAAR